MLGPAYAAIRSKLEAEAPLPDLAWFGEPYERPAEPRPWALVRVIGGVDQLATLAGRGRARGVQFGLVHVFVLVPKGAGQHLATDIADAFAAVLQRQDFGARVLTDDARIDGGSGGSDIVRDLTDTYAVTLVSVPFEFHHAR